MTDTPGLAECQAANEQLRDRIHHLAAQDDWTRSAIVAAAEVIDAAEAWCREQEAAGSQDQAEALHTQAGLLRAALAGPQP